jgi:RNA polymerase sigma-70 factor (ECF subfamily)
MTQITEAIRKVLGGDTECFRLVVERFEEPIVRMIRNITGDGESCEDIAQEVFLTAYKKLASFDPARSNFSTWLFTIARNKSINALKRKRPSLMCELPETADQSDPSDNAVEKDFLNKLDRRLQALPLRQKRAFVLAEFEGLSYEEIAQIEAVPIGTIKSRINRAKKKLRSALKETYGDAL